jgi:ATP-dependent DNA helicase RecQ
LTTPNRPLPPAIEAAHRILAEHGPLPATDLRQRLSAMGLVQTLDRIQQYADRFPNRFEITADGLLSIASVPDGETIIELDDGRHDSDVWYVPNPNRIHPDRVAVLDLETTGLTAATDFITEIALVRLDGTPLASLSVRTPEGVARRKETPDSATSLDQALRALGVELENIDLLVGHNLLAFDLPFLKKAADRAGIPAPQWPRATADTLHLSLLVDVAMPNRQLADLTQRYGIVNEEPHHALADATTTAAVLRALLADIDMTEPSWAIAIAILETYGSALAQLMPVLSVHPDLSLLSRNPDPLLVQSQPPVSDAWSTTRDALRLLHEQRGLRPRRAQQEMAFAVAEVFERGGRLAVEAPTGTGKSLAYMLPALGRASRPGQPVVIATATKALQTQLRDEAKRLHSEGLLAVPFRQIQGVSNYVCTRELKDALTDKDASGLALAVAVRTMSQAPTGTWDDVTDDAIRRADTRYTRTRARLRTTAAGCDRAKCAWASVCPLIQQISGLDKAPGIVSVNHALIASGVSHK